MSNHKNTTISREPELLKFLRVGIYIVAFIPLVIFSQFISPFHFGKIVVFRSLIEILAVVYVVLLIKYGKAYLPPRTPLFWAVTLFTAAFGLTTFTSVNVFQSFFGTLERMGGWLSFLHFWGLFMIASVALWKKEHWLTFIKLSLFVSLLSAFYGFLQKTDIEWVIGSGGRAKIFGTIGNPALFAGYMIVNAFLALTMLFRPQSSYMGKNFYGWVFIIDSFAVLLTGVRGSVLALAVGMILFGFLYASNIKSNFARQLRSATIIFLIFLVAVGALLYSLRNAEFIQNSHYLARYSDISPKAYTVQTRVWAWKAGFDGWNDSLKTIIFGWGPEMFNIPFSKHFNPKFYRGPGSETLFDRAHNQFFEVIVTMGIIGFLAYLLIFIYAFKILKHLGNGKAEDANLAENKEKKVFKVGLICTLVAYMIHNSFIFDTSANFIMFFLVLGFINFWAIKRMRLKDDAKFNFGIPRRNFAAAFVGVILMIGAAFSIFYTNIRPAQANYATTRAIVATWAGKHDLAFEKFKKALSYNTFGKYEIRHRYAQYILKYANPRDLDEKIEERLLVAAEAAKKNAEEFKQDYLPYLYMSRAYIILGRKSSKSSYNDLALENSLKALEISPTYVRTYYEVAQAYLNKKNYQEALKWFKKAVELNPEVGLSHWYLGITTIQMGNIEEGLKIIENSNYNYKGNENDIARLLNVYIKLNNLEKITELYEALVKLKPKNPQYHASLATAYAKTGRIQEAIKEAQIAAALDPSFREEAEQFIKSIRGY